MGDYFYNSYFYQPNKPVNSKKYMTVIRCEYCNRQFGLEILLQQSASPSCSGCGAPLKLIGEIIEIQNIT